MNAAKKPFAASLRGLSSKAHSAGDSVRALKAESTTETEIVTANCWNSRPEIPSTNDIGMKTASSTTVVATIGEATLRIASIAASRDFMPRSMLTCAASTTTIASSTTSPIANTSPNSEMMLIEKPNSGKKMNVPMSETGMATSGMSVARQS